MFDALVFDSCFGRGQIRFFLKKPGDESICSDWPVTV